MSVPEEVVYFLHIYIYTWTITLLCSGAPATVSSTFEPGACIHVLAAACSCVQLPARNKRVKAGSRYSLEVPSLVFVGLVQGIEPDSVSLEF